MHSLERHRMIESAIQEREKHKARLVNLSDMDQSMREQISDSKLWLMACDIHLRQLTSGERDPKSIEQIYADLTK